MRDRSMARREFLQVLTGAAAGAVTASAAETQTSYQHRLRKALIVNKPVEDALRAVREAGFDGIEAGILPPDEAAAARKLAEGLGLRIHSVLRGWASFNSAKPAEVKDSIQVTVAAIEAARAYGADAVLLVPCKIGGMDIPAPGEFRVKFDPDTSHLKAVVADGNERFSAYMAAHNHAVDTSRVAIRELAAIAEANGVVLAVENVWNNLFVDPRHFASFVDSFESPWVRVYLDLGNHVKYSPTEEWVRTLGKRIAKCHVKDFELTPDGHGGKFVDIRDGSVNWPVVRRALDDVGYNGWMTIEGSGGLPRPEQNRRLDLILEGR